LLVTHSKLESSRECLSQSVEIASWGKDVAKSSARQNSIDR